MTDNSSATGTTAPRLVGWKRIATHLRCSERTARRWEAQEALPVHRHVHDTKSTVFAYSGELDAWLAARAANPPDPGPAAETPSAPPVGGTRAVLLAATALIVALILVMASRYLPEKTQGDLVLSTDPVANDLYRRGRALWEQRGEEASERAVSMLTAAVERDESFAEAWSSLALAWATLSTYSVEVEKSRAWDEAVVAASRALELDPTLAEARSLMAFIAQRAGDWAESQRIYEQALALDPDNPNLILWYSGHFRELGLFERAKELNERARALAPTSPAVLTEIAMNHLQDYQDEEGAALLTHLREDQGITTPVIWFGSGMLALRRNDAPALDAWIEETPFAQTSDVLREFVTARGGVAAAVEQVAQQIDQAHREERLPGWAAFYLLLDLERPALALTVAEREVIQREFINSAVFYDLRRPAVRQSPRFTALVDGLGMLRYWREVAPPDFCAAQPQTPVCQAIVSAEASLP